MHVNSIVLLNDTLSGSAGDVESMESLIDVDGHTLKTDIVVALGWMRSSKVSNLVMLF